MVRNTNLSEVYCYDGEEFVNLKQDILFDFDKSSEADLRILTPNKIIMEDCYDYCPLVIDFYSEQSICFVCFKDGKQIYEINLLIFEGIPATVYVSFC